MSNDKTPPTARLVGFHIDPAHRLPPPLQHVGLVNCDAPTGQMSGWGIEVRGATMFLVSPAGWTIANNNIPVRWDRSGPRTIFGPIPLANVTLIWQGASTEIIKAMQHYSLPEMRAAAPAREVGPAIDPKELGDP